MRVCVLLSTYNGAEYIVKQIESLLNQIKCEVIIWVRDDGSSDKTQQILESYQKQGLIRWYQGNNIGPAKSFIELMFTAPESDYYAFCDQDDYWHPEKLYRAIERCNHLLNVQEIDPVLYFSDIKPVNDELEDIFYEKIVPKIDIYTECIMNYAFGCTMVFNKVLKDLVCKDTTSYLNMHDWWIYLVCLAVNGHVVYDENTYIYYRQHGNNASGFKEDPKKRFIRRLKKVLLEKENRRSKMLKEVYRIYNSDIKDPQIKELIFSLAYYDSSFLRKIKIITDKRLRCGKVSSNINFRLSIIINRY